MSTQETPPVLQRVLASSTSLRILASAVVVLFLYYAAGVVITILLSVLIAYFLDPAVEYLERLRVPRTIGALIMVVLLIAVLGAAGYGLYDRTSQFAAAGKRTGCQRLHRRLRARRYTANPILHRSIAAVGSGSGVEHSCSRWSFHTNGQSGPVQHRRPRD